MKITLILLCLIFIGCENQKDISNDIYTLRDVCIKHGRIMSFNELSEWTLGEMEILEDSMKIILVQAKAGYDSPDSLRRVENIEGRSIAFLKLN